MWIAWQLHRADLDEGLVLAFRRKDCRQPSLHVKLRGLTPQGLHGELPRPAASHNGRREDRPGTQFSCDRASRAAEQRGDSLRAAAVTGNAKRKRPLPCPFPWRSRPLPFPQRDQPPPGWGSRCRFPAILDNIPPIAGIGRGFFRFHPQILCLFGRLNYREIPKNRNLRTLPPRHVLKKLKEKDHVARTD